MMTTLLIAMTLHGCSLFGGDAGLEATLAAKKQMKAGQLVAAADAFDAAAKAHPDSIDAASGAALAALMRGDAEAADAFLAGVQSEAGERTAEVRMRRAIVAQRAKDWDAMREHGEASGMNAGLLLAGEAALADGEREEAEALFQRVGGDAEPVAREYIRLLNSENPVIAGMSEAQALWALGLRKVAVKSVAPVLADYPREEGDRDEQLLIWSSRATSVRETETARALLKLVRASGKLAWRKAANAALVDCADGNAGRCKRGLDKLEDSAPADGLADARVTAAALIARKDPQAAKDLAGPYRSAGAARALYSAGARQMAARSATPGPLAGFVGE
ncbi:MAG: hypothetical protein VX127_12495 [Myxococcota bacterium]|nr:hypothetical protein [Myxococcota bacterium]